MNTRIMAVALVAVGLFGVYSAQAQEVELVRFFPLITPDGSNNPLDDSWVSLQPTIIVLGRPNDQTTTFPPLPSCPSGDGCGALFGETWKNIEVLVLWHLLFIPPA